MTTMAADMLHECVMYDRVDEYSMRVLPETQSLHIYRSLPCSSSIEILRDSRLVTAQCPTCMRYDRDDGYFMLFLQEISL